MNKALYIVGILQIAIFQYAMLEPLLGGFVWILVFAVIFAYGKLYTEIGKNNG